MLVVGRNQPGERSFGYSQQENLCISSISSVFSAPVVASHVYSLKALRVVMPLRVSRKCVLNERRLV